MDNDFNLNTRTLIVSFVFALMVMVPLRFVEVGNFEGQYSPTVLGDSIEAPVAQLEAPYNEIDRQPDCLSSDYVDKVVVFLKNQTKVKGISKVEKTRLTDEIAEFELRRCN